MVSTLVDNVYDALLGADETVTRAPFTAGTAQAPQFESGATQVGLIAEHGFSAMVTVRRGSTTTSVLFDTGLSRRNGDQRRARGPGLSITPRGEAGLRRGCRDDQPSSSHGS